MVCSCPNFFSIHCHVAAAELTTAAATELTAAHTLAISLVVSLLFVSSAILLVTATTAFVLCCRRRRDRPGSESGHRVPGATPSGGIYAGAAIRSLPGVETTLPAFSYPPQDGEHGGSALECAVCLGAVKEGEMVRQLPACMHVYHVGCIDRWLAAHQTCPVCRSIAAYSIVLGGELGFP